MKKSEILTFLSESGVKASNLLKFYKRRKANREAINAVRGGYGAVLKWLEEKEQKEQAAQRRLLIKKYSSDYNMSAKEYEELQEKAFRLLDDFHTGHSMGCHRFLSINKKTFAHNHDLQEYAASCQWQPTYGHITLRFTKKDLRCIANIRGVWTVMLGQSKAKWLAQSGQKNRYEVDWVEGYVYKGAHAKTLNEARELYRKREQGKKQDAARFVGMKHRHEFGACEAGVKAFCARHGLNPNYGYSVAYLKSLNDPITEKYL